MNNLFVRGNLRLSSGQVSTWKIECDSLTVADWECLAHVAIERRLVPPFSAVVGVFRGGLPFARALDSYVTPDAEMILVVDDVYTTGWSIWDVLRRVKIEAGDDAHVRGLVAFAREPIHNDTITAIWTIGGDT
jgi:orotate phosphoribosyltransferase